MSPYWHLFSAACCSVLPAFCFFSLTVVSRDQRYDRNDAEQGAAASRTSASRACWPDHISMPPPLIGCPPSPSLHPCRLLSSRTSGGFWHTMGSGCTSGHGIMGWRGFPTLYRGNGDFPDCGDVCGDMVGALS